VPWVLPAQGEEGDVVPGGLTADQGSHHRDTDPFRWLWQDGLAKAGEAVIDGRVPRSTSTSVKKHSTVPGARGRVVVCRRGLSATSGGGLSGVTTRTA